uniref:Uncharacterized protein n=1 Tax=Meloidogyne enterolobii TaxID=390850 RepID=A0A6V7X5W8_MELEN|nr:unnamed protein product [Meloidogyne enterolobii]
MCFQCHMPIQCKSGFCFGDYCVKSIVANKYVSKGCENKTKNGGNYFEGRGNEGRGIFYKNKILRSLFMFLLDH